LFQAPVRTPAPKAQPYLLLSTTAQYTWLYDDSGSHAHMNLTLWRTDPTDSSAFIIGDYAQGYYGEPAGPTVTVTSVNDPHDTLLQRPVDYRLVWNDHGTGGHNDGSIWYPVPPDDFVSIGFVGQRGYDKPSIAKYRCVHRSQVVGAQVGPLIWNDSGSHAHLDVSLFSVVGVSGIFVAQPNYDPYVGPLHQFKSQ
jgi:hypothetical protein